MEKVFVAIDGGNFYRKLKKLGFLSVSEFDYQGFSKWLAGKGRLVGICYYVGRIREEPNNPKSTELKSGQDRFLANLANQNISVKTGYILKSDGGYSEKGVDVQISVDICMKGVRNEYDRVILVSSDTDLIPAIKEAQNLKKTVEYIGFADSPSFAMIRFSNSRRLLRKEDLQPFTKDKI